MGTGASVIGDRASRAGGWVIGEAVLSSEFELRVSRHNARGHWRPLQTGNPKLELPTSNWWFLESRSPQPPAPKSSPHPPAPAFTNALLLRTAQAEFD